MTIEHQEGKLKTRRPRVSGHPSKKRRSFQPKYPPTKNQPFNDAFLRESKVVQPKHLGTKI
ncbi:MAG: hypothetical protein H7A24_13400 [Leptospiraceae bacterium]|nr:hypothetical protein [Leptospiraceae bacterium]